MLETKLLKPSELPPDFVDSSFESDNIGSDLYSSLELQFIHTLGLFTMRDIQVDKTKSGKVPTGFKFEYSSATMIKSENPI